MHYSTSRAQQWVDYQIFETGAEQYPEWIDEIKGLNIAIFANHTSTVGDQHLMQLLLSNKVNLVKIFSPEHGFEGKLPDGAEVEDSIIKKSSNIPVISLYGNKKKPGVEDLVDVDLVLFDIQDVGTRCYTYISSLGYMMEACAQTSTAIWVLDRPNPNGFYIDGPMLDTAYRSFVGLFPVPLVYGMTIGELALMIQGMEWIPMAKNLELRVIPVKNYKHDYIFSLPVPPSPNLPNWQSVYLYPSLVLFEGSIMSVGRGTDHPFQCYGHPDYGLGSFSFTPESRPKSSKFPKHEGKTCFGQSLLGYAEAYPENPAGIHLVWLTDAYEYFSRLYPQSDFFNSYFTKIAGTPELEIQIKSKLPSEQIKQSWQQQTGDFIKSRSEYLIYP